MGLIEIDFGEHVEELALTCLCISTLPHGANKACHNVHGQLAPLLDGGTRPVRCAGENVKGPSYSGM